MQGQHISKVASITAVISSIVVIPAAALASSGAHHGHGSAADLFPYVISFLVYAVALFLLVRKPIANGWSARRNRILSAISDADRAHAEASAEYAAADRSFATLDAQSEALRNAIKDEADRDATLAIDRAKERVRQMLSDAERTLKAERMKAEGRLRRELTENIVKAAQERIISSLTPEKDRALRGRVVDKVPTLVQ